MAGLVPQKQKNVVLKITVLNILQVVYKNIEKTNVVDNKLQQQRIS